jgi:hypothetical protein
MPSACVVHVRLGFLDTELIKLVTAVKYPMQLNGTDTIMSDSKLNRLFATRLVLIK